MQENYKKTINNSNETALINELNITKFLLPLILGNGEDKRSETSLKQKAVSLGIIKADSEIHYRTVVTSFFGNSSKEPLTEEDVLFINSIIEDQYDSYSFLVGKNVVSVFFHNCKSKEKLRSLLKEIPKNTLTHLNRRSSVGVSRDAFRLSLCSSSYFEALTAVRYNAESGNNLTFISDIESETESEYEPNEIEKTVINLEELLKSGSTENLLMFLDTLYTEQNRKTLDYIIIQILASVCKTVSTVSGGAGVSDFFGLNPVLLKAAYYANGNGIKDDMRRLCLDAREIISKYQKRDSELICDSAVNIINSEYYDENLSLTSVGTRLNISPNYLSTLIKKITGQNFITLLTERRMKAAHDMLLLSHNNINEIAEKCGYSDQHYFGFCFKKYYGITPSKFRQINKNTS